MTTWTEPPGQNRERFHVNLANNLLMRISTRLMFGGKSGWQQIHARNARVNGLSTEFDHSGGFQLKCKCELLMTSVTAADIHLKRRSILQWNTPAENITAQYKSYTKQGLQCCSMDMGSGHPNYF